MFRAWCETCGGKWSDQLAFKVSGHLEGFPCPTELRFDETVTYQGKIHLPAYHYSYDDNSIVSRCGFVFDRGWVKQAVPVPLSATLEGATCLSCRKSFLAQVFGSKRRRAIHPDAIDKLLQLYETLAHRALTDVPMNQRDYDIATRLDVILRRNT